MNRNKNKIGNQINKTNSSTSEKGFLNTNTLSKQAQNAAQKISNKGVELKDKALGVIKDSTDVIKNKISNIGKKADNFAVKMNVKEPLGKWATMTSEFMTANTAISKFVMFMLIILLFIILLQTGFAILSKLYGPETNPYIINGMVASNIQTIISANPNVSNSVPIYRSVNALQGIEYSWNTWFIVQDNKSIGDKLIFSKGNSTSSNSTKQTTNGTTIDLPNSQYMNVSPGLFLNTTNNSNTLTVVINTYNPIKIGQNYYETVVINDIPMQKWICCTIRVQGTYVDVYINGVLAQRKILMNLPHQNYYDTYIGSSNGFNGYISSLRYYANAISYDEIQTLFSAGPSLKMVSSATMPLSNDFLSMNWFYKYT